MLQTILGTNISSVIVGLGVAEDDMMGQIPSWPSQAAVHVIRFGLLAVASFVLGACAAHVPSSNQNVTDKSDLYRFIEPTNGAAYSQGSINYYLPPGVGR
jgi:hypothetical protein